MVSEAPADESQAKTNEGKGYINESLSRSNAQIRKDRGDDIAEELEIVFKRAAENTHRKINRLIRERKNMYDFSPQQTTSLVMLKDVDADEIKSKDDALTLEIRNTRIQLELDIERYKDLFGVTLNFD
jgi:uncharacterized protein YccT (UPF0319 family)